MIEKKIFSRDLDKGISGLQCNEKYQITVVFLKRQLLEMEDTHFHHDSAVMLPGAIDEDPKKGLSGIAVLAAALKHSKNYPDDKLLIAGHADTSGDPSYNTSLSYDRAESVLACLTGDRNGWIELCLKKSKVEDYQHILKWLSIQSDWSCDPGKVDNVKGEKTIAAIKNFQADYNSRYKQSITVDGEIGKQTWGAFFDVYSDTLKRQLSADDKQLSEYRASLKFVDPSKKTTGCGENYPIEEKDKKNFRSETNRRVELLFFNTGEEPSLACTGSSGCKKPEACEVYRKNAYEPVYIDIEGDGTYIDLVVQWPENHFTALPTDLVLSASAGEVTCELKWSEGTLVDSMRQFIFNRMPFKKECTLTAKSASTTLVLWNRQFVHDKNNPPTFEHLLDELLPSEEQVLTDIAQVEIQHEEVLYGCPRFD